MFHGDLSFLRDRDSVFAVVIANERIGAIRDERVHGLKIALASGEENGGFPMRVGEVGVEVVAGDEMTDRRAL